MRTVTFSDAALARALKDRFICTWVNREPGFHNCDLTAERQISTYESFATKNFVTFFTTPDLDVLHYASGFFRPAIFMKEVQLVDALKGAVLDLRNRYMEDALPEFSAIHEEHACAHKTDLEKLQQAEPPKEKKGKGRNREGRQHHVTGLSHLSTVHRDLYSKSGKLKGPVPLDAVWKSYLFGNGFEENRWSERRRDPDRRGPGM